MARDGTDEKLLDAHNTLIKMQKNLEKWNRKMKKDIKDNGEKIDAAAIKIKVLKQDVENQSDKIQMVKFALIQQSKTLDRFIYK